MLARQDALQAEARAFLDQHDVESVLARLGTVEAVGSYPTSLMVWRDLDFVVDAPGADVAEVWRTVLPLIAPAALLHYENDRENGRYYFVITLDEWKLDVSVFHAGVPPDLETFRDELSARLRDEPELRVLLLRLKDEWYSDPEHDRTVGYEIYRAVFDHGVRTTAELEAHLS